MTFPFRGAGRNELELQTTRNPLLPAGFGVGFVLLERAHATTSTGSTRRLGRRVVARSEHCKSRMTCVECAGKGSGVHGTLAALPMTRAEAEISPTYTYPDIAKMIDHSMLAPAMTTADFDAGIALALEYEVASVCIVPSYLRRCA